MQLSSRGSTIVTCGRPRPPVCVLGWKRQPESCHKPQDHSKHCNTRAVVACSARARHVAAPQRNVRASASQALTGDTVSTDKQVRSSEVVAVKRPILSGGGGGIFFFWQLGVIKYLLKHYDLSKVDMVGASAGALIVTLAMCKIDPDKAIQTAYQLAEENNVWKRRLGLAGIWGGLVRQWLDILLPDNAAEVCKDRLKLVITRLPFLDIAYVFDFTSKQDLIDACLASAHVPFFLDGNAYCTYRGQKCIDGSLSDFVTKGNSELLQCEGSAFIMDYYEDSALSVGRWDFLKLRSYEEVMALVQSGSDYAERTDQAKGFQALRSVAFDISAGQQQNTTYQQGLE